MLRNRETRSLIKVLEHGSDQFATVSDAQCRLNHEQRLMLDYGLMAVVLCQFVLLSFSPNPGAKMSNLSIIDQPIAALKPNDANARTHSPKQIQQIANSIARFGFNNRWPRPFRSSAKLRPIACSDDPFGASYRSAQACLRHCG